MTTTDIMLTSLQATAEALAQEAAAKAEDFEATKMKAQETAWSLGWNNSINRSLDEMLVEIGLQPRPVRLGLRVKVRISTEIPVDHIESRVGAIIPFVTWSRPLAVSQVAELLMTAIPFTHVPHDFEVGGCWCEQVDGLDLDTVTSALREQQGIGETVGIEVLAMRCGSHQCPNRSRTALED